jgi:uncharacterized membrane-anchored protein
MDAQTEEVNQKPQSVAERKASLIRQGELYRVGVVQAKAHVKYAARPEQLFHSALNQAGWLLRSRIDSLLKPGGASVSAIMPYAMALIGFLRKRKAKAGKASLGVSLALAGIGLYLQQRRVRQATH